MPIYLPLRPGTKVCNVPGWNEPGYPGVSLLPEHEYGLRLDDLVVIDADCSCVKVNGRKPEVCETQWAAVEAVQAWRAHVGTDAGTTWLRKTPHGFHLFYARVTADALKVTTRKLRSISPTLELKTGIAAYVVFSAPGYHVVDEVTPLPRFDAAWLPQQADARATVDEWSELPDGIGNDFLTSMAGKLREWGADEQTIYRALQGVNATTMSRPMSARAVQLIARSVARYAPAEVADRATFDCPTCSTKWEGS